MWRNHTFDNCGSAFAMLRKAKIDTSQNSAAEIMDKSVRPTSGQFNFSAFIQMKMRVPGNLPQMAVRIGKIAAVTAPKNILRGFDDFPASLFRQPKNSRNLIFALDILRQGQAAKTIALRNYRCIFRKKVARI